VLDHEGPLQHPQRTRHNDAPSLGQPFDTRMPFGFGRGSSRTPIPAYLDTRQVAARRAERPLLRRQRASGSDQFLQCWRPKGLRNAALDRDTAQRKAARNAVIPQAFTDA